MVRDAGYRTRDRAGFGGVTRRVASLSKVEVETKRRAAYERGWADSLNACYAVCLQPWEDKFDYIKGWWACADWRRDAAPDSAS